ncbi:MAG: glycine cleavage system protein H [Desulfobacterales bacterium]|nr:glycine cleavage system protein H [Desulfobacterales bacterium]
MKENREIRRSNVGYGSSYIKNDMGEMQGTKSVLKGQVWTIKPDAEASLKNPCLWMRAGVVNFKNCNNFYDCVSCKYDLGMRSKVESGKSISWQDAMRKKPALQRVCRHSLTNRIEKRACAYDYQCSSCDFDQYFEEILTLKTKSTPYELHQVKGFNVPMDYYFHMGHAWAKIESGGYIRVGLDDFSLKLLGKADGFELPLMGKELDLGKAGWGLKREGNIADVLSPINGVIMEVNSKLREKPEIANHEPYEEGWLFMVRTPDIKVATKALMDDKKSMEWISSEVSLLENMIEEVAGPLAADGGYLADDIYGNLPGLGWNRLTKTFLRS